MGESIVAGVISGLISSVFIYIVTFRIKPKVNISDDICYDVKEKKYRIKVINLSHANLVDVKYTLHACYRSGDGIVDIYEIPPMKARLEFFQAYSAEDKEADYAVRLSYDLNDYVNKDYSYFLFTFHAKHAVSGTTVFIRKEFSKESIKCGRFETGKSAKVLLESCHNEFLKCDKGCQSEKMRS